jgi:hypothetical protein
MSTEDVIRIEGQVCAGFEAGRTRAGPGSRKRRAFSGGKSRFAEMKPTIAENEFE